MIEKSNDSQNLSDITVADLLKVVKYPKMDLDATATSASPGTYATVVDLTGHGTAKIRWEVESTGTISSTEESGIKVTIDGNVLEMESSNQQDIDKTYFDNEVTFEFQSSFKFEVRSGDDGSSDAWLYTGYCIYGYHTALP